MEEYYQDKWSARISLLTTVFPKYEKLFKEIDQDVAMAMQEQEENTITDFFDFLREGERYFTFSQSDDTLRYLKVTVVEISKDDIPKGTDEHMVYSNHLSRQE